MRQGVGAASPQQQGRASAETAQSYAAHPAASAHVRSNVSRLFLDLRGAVQLSPPQIAAHLQTSLTSIQALETGQFEYLPPWPETARIVMAYTAMAGIDGRPVLSAIAGCLQAPPPVKAAHVAPQNGAHHVQVERLRQAGTALANGAKRLPADAMKQVRERPERAFYAVSLPLGIVLLMLNTSMVQSALSHAPRPVVRMAKDVRQFLQEQFAPVHDGLRWIDVEDPRRRRGDKLHSQGQSD